MTTTDPIAPACGAVPFPRRPVEDDPGPVLSAEVRPAALVSGDVPPVGRGEVHVFGLALDEFTLTEERAGPDHGVEEREHGVDVRGTLVAHAAGVHRFPVLEVLGVPVLLLGRAALPAVGAHVLAAGFLSVERRLWAGAPRGVRPWRVARVRREEVTGLSAAGFTVTSTGLTRLPSPPEVDVRHQYVLDLRREVTGGGG